MADDLKLSSADQAMVMSWLNRKWAGTKQCVICAHNNWTVAEHLVTPTVTKPGGGMIVGPSYPSVIVICTTCGNTHFFNYNLIQKG